MSTNDAEVCGERVAVGSGRRAIEDGFSFELVSDVAEMESWRKELNRPIYHLHKWWAQRLGTVFRSAIIAATTPSGASLMDLFYSKIHLSDIVIFDPFMGSGTTVGEAVKLGCTAIGRDINPVAYRAVHTALGPLDRAEVDAQFKQVEATAGGQIDRLYQSTDSDDQPCTVLYYFWVKFLACPKCHRQVDLFSSYIFASHADKARHPEAKVVCPDCGDIIHARHDATEVRCGCGASFDPRVAPARRADVVCRYCDHRFSIAKTALAAGCPPSHRMYAKLVLRADGVKEYLPPSREDLSAFEDSRQRLIELAPAIPSVPIEDGYNTRQMLNYGYHFWHEMFNPRQLLALTILANSIRELPAGNARSALALLFSGTLEFNNMFVSYKGEGTGAVRHLFAHHILKPERTPIEANLWGTPKSSGAFSTLYRSRLLRAMDYRSGPFEIAVGNAGRRRSGRKVFGVSEPIGGRVLSRYPKDGLRAGDVYLSCGDSAKTDLPDRSVDLVVTDPPFFDNVHYSELADFFYAWQRLYFPTEETKRTTTRRPEEVQDTEAHAFTAKLRAVFAECHRVLREEGLLVFSYHHSRESGWLAVAAAVLGAQFSIVEAQPVKAEMSVAMPKGQTKEPINLDVLIVCRKEARDRRPRRMHEDALSVAAAEAKKRIRRFNATGRRLSRNDVGVVLLGLLLVELSAGRSAEQAVRAFDALLPPAKQLIEAAWRRQSVQKRPLVEDVQQALPLELMTPSAKTE